MGWYIRKSKNFGLFRLNLSKSGLGFSTGIKGARISVGPNGTYFNGGSNGLYYRKKLSGSSNRNKKRYVNRNANYLNENKVTNSFNSDSSLLEINKEVKKTRLLNTLYIITLVLLFSWGVNDIDEKNSFIGFVVFIIALILKIVFNKFFIYRIDYSLDFETKERWDNYLSSLNSAFSSKKVWLITSRVRSQNKGYTDTIARKKVGKRKIVKENVLNKSRIKFNQPVYQIATGNYTIIFAPTMIVFVKGSSVKCYSYKDISIFVTFINFVEESKLSVPRDAYVTGMSWQYSNKNGGPDLRYKNNKQLPTCRYGVFRITSDKGDNIELEFSDYSSIEPLRKSTSAYVSYICNIPDVDPATLKKEEFDDSILDDDTKKLFDNNSKNNKLLDDIYSNIDLGDNNE